MMPPLVTARVSMIGLLLQVIVAAAGMESEPVPPMVPEVQVIALPVRLIGAVPLSVPPLMVSVGMLSVLALLSVSVPPWAGPSPTLWMLLGVVVPPKALVAPMTL